MEVVLMKSPNSEGNGTPTGHLRSLNKLPIPGVGYIQLNCWQKGSTENPKQFRLLPRQQVALYQLKERPHCRR